MNTELTPEQTAELEKAMASRQSKQTEATVYMPAIPPAMKDLPDRERALVEQAILNLTKVATTKREREQVEALERKERNSAAARLLKAEFVATDVRKHAVEPHIPSVEAAAAHGSKPTDYDRFLRVTGLQPLQLPFPVGNDLDVLERVALQLLPAFLIEYGHKYPYSPKTIVASWVRAMTPEPGKTGFSAVSPEQLREVVRRIAVAGEQFNPRTMMKHAVQMRLDVGTGMMKPPAIANPGHQFEFFRTVANEGKFEPTNWIASAEYPAAFPKSAIDDSTLGFINNVVHYRWHMEHKNGLTAVLARALAENMLAAVIYRLNHNGTATLPQIFGLSYRFHLDYLSSFRPSNASTETSDRPALSYDPTEEM